MKQDYSSRFPQVVFMDSATGAKFLAGSTMESQKL